MKTKNSAQLLSLATIALLALPNCSPKSLLSRAAADGSGDLGEVMSITPIKSAPLNLSDFFGATNYAVENGYTDGSSCLGTLKEGTKVAFSTSSQLGGELAQLWGVLKEENGGLYFQKKGESVGMGLLPPGLPFNDGRRDGVSKWELREYMGLVCKTVFAKDAQGQYANSSKVYSAIEANKVDITAGTANQKFTYSNLLQLKLKHTGRSGTVSDLAVFFGQGEGVQVFEFSQTGMPKGTVKIYFQPKG